MVDEIEYEGLPPNAGLSVGIFSLTVNVSSQSCYSQVNMLAGALVGIFSDRWHHTSGCSYRRDFIILGWNNGACCHVPCR